MPSHAPLARVVSVLLALGLAAKAHAQPGAWAPELEHAVFKVRAGTDADRDVYARSLGFLIDDAGLGITGFSTIQRSQIAGKVVFERAEAPLDFDVLGVDPASNLALIRVDLSAIPDFARPAPLRFRRDPVEPGQALHVLGDWRVQGGTRRAVSGALVERTTCAEMPTSLRRATGCTTAASWLRINAPIHVTHTGGPVLDDDGAVVGLATWAWTESDTESLAIDAEELTAFVERYREAEPIDLVRERRAWARIELGQSAFPILEMDQRGKVQTAALAGRRLRSTVPCPSCNGTQLVKEKRRVGERLLPGMRQPVHEIVEVPCTARNANGYNDTFRIVGKGDRVGPLERYIGAIATMDVLHENAQQVLMDSRDELDKMMVINPVAWTNHVVNPQAKRRISAIVPEIGTPIIAVGMLMKGRDIIGGLTPLRTVKLIEYRCSPSQFMTRYNTMNRQLVAQRWFEEGLIEILQEPKLVIHNPIHVDAVPGEIVMVTGLLAGFVTDTQGTRQPVIQDGFIVTPRPHLAFDDD